MFHHRPKVGSTIGSVVLPPEEPSEEPSADVGGRTPDEPLEDESLSSLPVLISGNVVAVLVEPAPALPSSPHAAKEKRTKAKDRRIGVDGRTRGQTCNLVREYAAAGKRTPFRVGSKAAVEGGS